MRKLFCTLLLVAGIMSFGQANNYADVTFFGTDFSLVKIYAGGNSPTQFQDAFYEINRLFLTEPKKYNVEKLLGAHVSTVDLKPVEIQNRQMDLSGLLIDGYGGYEITGEQLSQAVKNLQTGSKEGVGLVIVAEVLNKSSAHGSFKIVFFDIAKRDILEVREGKGKARGFGLRNYWAHAMLEAMKKAR